jgi:hypothetical protein
MIRQVERRFEHARRILETVRHHDVARRHTDQQEQGKPRLQRGHKNLAWIESLGRLKVTPIECGGRTTVVVGQAIAAGWASRRTRLSKQMTARSMCSTLFSFTSWA